MRKAGWTEKLASCFEAQQAATSFSGVVMIQTPGGDIFRRAAGFADSRRGTPMRLDTRFRVASVTKVITRAAIALLVDQKRIRLDAPVGTYVRGLPAEIAAVTIDQLLTHRSGVAALSHVEGEEFDALMRTRTATEVLPLIVKRPLEFRPGERRVYSNGGFDLLGAVIEAVTGKTYAQHVEEAVFRPLGMRSSSMIPRKRLAVHRTNWESEGPPRPQRFADRVARPSGGSIHSAGDLLKLGRALMGGSFLSPALKPRILEMMYGGVAQIGARAGENAGFMALESGWTIIVLSNFDPPAGELMTMLFWEAIKGRPCTPKPVPSTSGTSGQ